MMSESALGISVIICCYNSSQRIHYALKHLEQQSFEDDLRWEVIVVDNASSDGTGRIAESIWREFNCDIPFRVVTESEPGLSHARNKGVAEARFEYLIFCD